MKKVQKNTQHKNSANKQKPAYKAGSETAGARAVPKLSSEEEALLDGISSSDAFSLKQVLKRNSIYSVNLKS